MTFDECTRRIDRYLSSQEHSTVLVDVPTKEYLERLHNRYETGNRFLSVRQYANEDNLPISYRMTAALGEEEGHLFLEDITFYYALCGEQQTREILRALLDVEVRGKCVVVTFACATILQPLDPRLIERNRVLLVDGVAERLPSLFFVPPALPLNKKDIRGINNIGEVIPLPWQGEIVVETHKKRDDYPRSLYTITECKTSYDVLRRNEPAIAKIVPAAGSSGQWEALLQKIQKEGSWEKYVLDTFGNSRQLAGEIHRWDSYKLQQKWEYYLALRVYGVEGNDYLTAVVTRATTYEEFLFRCYTHLLDYPVKEEPFWKYYAQRQEVVRYMPSEHEARVEYLQRVHGKGSAALYYLTANTREEKETTIALLAQYGKGYSRRELMNILQHTYPTLGDYLATYTSGNKDLDKYIDEYKYCKVVNTITDDMRNLVEAQAKMHQYISWLQERSVYIDKLCQKEDKDKAKVYFVDAMGIEYLHLWQEQCYNNGLDLHIDIARCCLPSVTEYNKAFLGDLRQRGYSVVETRSLDRDKHEERETYNYEKTKLPIHLIDEMDIITALIDGLKTLQPGETAYVVADHGATRLAVINEHETKYMMSEKGKHGGRCCHKGLDEEKTDYIIEENGHWCLANYDRFAGSRKADVEVHGGATIEEMAVPILTIRCRGRNISCKVVGEKITLSPRTTPTITLYVGGEIGGDVEIELLENRYPATPAQEKYHYSVALPATLKAGTHTFNVYRDNILLAKGLIIEIIKGAKENKYF